MAAATIVGACYMCVAAFPRTDCPAAKPGAATGREIGLIAAALIAVSAFQIRWAWEARMYTMGAALAAFSGWALLRALNTNGILAWVVYSALAVPFLYTHSYAVLTIAAHFAFFIGILLFGHSAVPVRGRIARNGLASFALTALAWAGWVPVLLSQYQRIVDDFWTQPLTFSYVEQAIQVMFLGPEDLSPTPIVGHLVTAGCIVICLLLPWRGQVGHWLIFCCAVVPIMLSLCVSGVTRNIFHSRYLLFAHVFLATALAALICRVSHPGTRRLLAIWATFVGLSLYVHFWWGLDLASKPGARAAAAMIDEHRNVGESVIAASPMLYYPMRFHSSDRSGWLMYNDRDLPYVHYYGSAVLDPSTLITRQQLPAVDGAALWVVEMSGDVWQTRPVPVESPWELESMSSYPELYIFQGTIYLKKYKYRPAGAPAPEAGTSSTRGLNYRRG
jgi:hypothetical protein